MSIQQVVTVVTAKRDTWKTMANHSQHVSISTNVNLDLFTKPIAKMVNVLTSVNTLDVFVMKVMFKLVLIHLPYVPILKNVLVEHKTEVLLQHVELSKTEHLIHALILAED